MEYYGQNNRKYLRPGTIFCTNLEYDITTVLGSCVAICLWDPSTKVGGMNHYMLPFWNGEGLPSPKYGNIAIVKLIEKIYSLGASRGKVKAKIFGGSSNFQDSSVLKVSDRNITIACDLLNDAGIPIINSAVGGKYGRKIIFSTATGTVRLKKLITQRVKV